MHSTVTNRGGENDASEDRLDRDVRFQMKMTRDDLLDDNDVERILSRPSLSRRKLEIYEGRLRHIYSVIDSTLKARGCSRPIGRRGGLSPIFQTK